MFAVSPVSVKLANIRNICLKFSSSHSKCLVVNKIEFTAKNREFTFACSFAKNEKNVLDVIIDEWRTQNTFDNIKAFFLLQIEIRILIC